MYHLPLLFPLSAHVHRCILICLLAQSVYTVASPATTMIDGVPHIIIQQPPQAHSQGQIQQHVIPVDHIRVPVDNSVQPMDQHQQQLTQPPAISLAKGAVLIGSSTDSPQAQTYQERKSTNKVMGESHMATSVTNEHWQTWVPAILLGFSYHCVSWYSHVPVFPDGLQCSSVVASTIYRIRGLLLICLYWLLFCVVACSPFPLQPIITPLYNKMRMPFPC